MVDAVGDTFDDVEGSEMFTGDRPQATPHRLVVRWHDRGHASDPAVTGIQAAVLVEASRVDLADSALHAPAAGFGETEFYPDIYDKAAVPCSHLSWNHG